MKSSTVNNNVLVHGGFVDGSGRLLRPGILSAGPMDNVVNPVRG
jgi:hypothetical protein